MLLNLPFKLKLNGIFFPILKVRSVTKIKVKMYK